MYSLANFHNLKKVVSTDEVLYNYYCAPKDSNKGPSVINSMYTREFWNDPHTIWYKQKDNLSIIEGYLAKYPSDWQIDMRYTRYFDYLFFDLFFMYTTKIEINNIYKICEKIFNDPLFVETLNSKKKYGLTLRNYSEDDLYKFIKLSYAAYADIKENHKNLSTLTVGTQIFANIFFDMAPVVDTLDFVAKTYKEYVEQSSKEAKYVKEWFDKYDSLCDSEFSLDVIKA